MNRFVLKNTFIKVYIHIPLFDKYFYKNKESKLDFGNRVVVLNDFLYGYGGSIYNFRLDSINCHYTHTVSFCSPVYI